MAHDPKPSIEGTMLSSDPDEAIQQLKKLGAGEPLIYRIGQGNIMAKIVTAGSVNIISGEPGEGKTFTGLEFSALLDSPDITKLADWCFAPVDNVAYLLLEGHEGLAERMTVLKHRHPNHRIRIGAISHLNMQPERAAGEVRDFLEANGMQLEGKKTVIFIDPLVDAYGGTDENNAVQMHRAMKTGLRLTRLGHNITVFIIAHKGAGKKDTRGSTALPGDAGTIIKVEKTKTMKGWPDRPRVPTGEKIECGITLELGKNRHGAEDLGLMLYLISTPAGTFGQYTTTSCYLKPVSRADVDAFNAMAQAEKELREDRREAVQMLVVLWILATNAGTGEFGMKQGPIAEKLKGVSTKAWARLAREHTDGFRCKTSRDIIKPALAKLFALDMIHASQPYKNWGQGTGVTYWAKEMATGDMRNLAKFVAAHIDMVIQSPVEVGDE